MIIRSYVVGETHGSEAASIRATAELWRAGGLKEEAAVAAK